MTARQPRFAAGIARATLLASLLTTPCLAEVDGDEASLEAAILLEVVINSEPTHKLVEFSMRNGVLHADRQELEDLGFVLSGDSAAGGGDIGVTAALAGAKLQIDQSSQTVYITAPKEILQPEFINLSNRLGNDVLAHSSTGAVFDYDMVLAKTPFGASASGNLGFRIFSPIGVFSSDALVFIGRDPSAGSEIIRLDTSYVFSNVNNLHTYTVGDYITSGLGWTRPVRLGGARLAVDFRTRPDLITFPVPTVIGSVAVPSTLDVLVNGSQVGSRTVQPGPFEISQTPLITGAGTISLTTTDALGRQVTTNQPFYASWDLLAPGLQTWSIEVGAVRRYWGTASDNYGDVGGSATYRRGISPNLTVEGHVEGAPDFFMAGGGVALNVADFATLNVSSAVSTFHGDTNGLFSIAAQRISPTFSFGAALSVAGHGFRDIAAMNGEAYPYRQLTLNAGLPLGRYGSLSAFFALADRDASDIPIGPVSTAALPPYYLRATHMRLATASYSGHAGNLAFFANAYKDFADGGSYGVLVGLSLPFGARSSADVSAGWNGNKMFGQAQVSRTADAVGDWGYRVFAATGETQHVFADAEYIAPWATLRVGVDMAGSDATFLAEARGAVSFADGGLFASNNIDDSFAIVDTHGAAGVRVLVENRFAGATDSSGRLLVPSLRSYELNNLSIDPASAPMDATMPVTAAINPKNR
ncbi:MAG TPA: fimbria/pilus outer membrane usher protein [Polymorphobacter sp.]|nr:fimbria/pilus outer membrane usher protein [Polymorphobacter sp.]